MNRSLNNSQSAFLTIFLFGKKYIKKYFKMKEEGGIKNKNPGKLKILEILPFQN